MSRKRHGRAANGRAESGFAPAEEPLELEDNEPEDLGAADGPLEDPPLDAAPDLPPDQDDGGGAHDGGGAAPAEDEWDFGRFIEANPMARGRVIDRNAYERQKRENAELKKQQAKFNERFDRMMEAVQHQGGGQQPQPKQPVKSDTELALDIVQRGLPPSELQYEDAEKYNQQVREFAQASAYLQRQQFQQSQQVEEQRQQDELHQRIDSALMESAQEALETMPDWSAAANHYENTIKRVISRQPAVKALPGPRRVQAIDAEFKGILRRVVAQAVQSDMSPAEVIYGMAEDLGYTPGATSTAAPASNPRRGAPKQDKRGSFKTLAKADGGPAPQGKSYQDLTMADMWNMTDEQWAQIEHEMLQAG